MNADSVMQTTKERYASVSVLVICIGRYGVGKSSLINSIAGKEVAKEGNMPFATTSEVESYKLEYGYGDGKVEMTAWDMPGLEDADDNSEDALKEIENKCKPSEVDLVILCIPFIDKRIAKGDVNVIQMFTERFGVEMWDHTMIAFTFANEVKPPPSSPMSVSDFFKKKLDEWRNRFREIIQDKLGVPEETVENIPMVPTGYRHGPLPDRPDWITDLWTASYSCTKTSAKPAIIKLTNISKQFASKKERFGTREDKQRRSSVGPGMLGSARGGLVRASAGAGVGAGIGAMVGLIVGPLGVAAGAAIGAVIGAIVVAGIVVVRGV